MRKIGKLFKNKRSITLFLGALMLFSTLAYVMTSTLLDDGSTDTGQDQPVYVGNWNGMNIYVTDTPIGPIYSLDVGGGYLQFRANPQTAYTQVGTSGNLDIYSRLMTSSTVYLLYDEAEHEQIKEAVLETTRFFRGRPFILEVGLTSPYQGNETGEVLYKDPWNVTEGETVVYVHFGDSRALTLANGTLEVTGSDAGNVTLSVTKLGLILYRLV